MGETCSTHGEIGKCIRKRNVKISREDLGINQMIITKWI
jgi:hypothetical protein